MAELDREPGALLADGSVARWQRQGKGIVGDVELVEGRLGDAPKLGKVRWLGRSRFIRRRRRVGACAQRCHAPGHALVPRTLEGGVSFFVVAEALEGEAEVSPRSLPLRLRGHDLLELEPSPLRLPGLEIA